MPSNLFSWVLGVKNRVHVLLAGLSLWLLPASVSLPAEVTGIITLPYRV